MTTIDQPSNYANFPRDELEKWLFLQRAPFEDAKTPEIRVKAHAMAAIAADSRWPEFAFANLAHCLARDCIVYQLDSERVGREQIDGFTDPQPLADEPYRRGYDDCDAKARFFVALCIAGGLTAAMVDRWTGNRLAHVYGSCMILGPNDKGRRLYFAETILRRARLGEVAENVPKELETGRWLQ